MYNMGKEAISVMPSFYVGKEFELYPPAEQYLTI
jgi:hypothetical protein